MSELKKLGPCHVERREKHRRWYDQLFSGTRKFLIIASVAAACFGAYKGSLEILGLSFVSQEAAAAKFAERDDLDDARRVESEHYELLKRDVGEINRELQTISDFLLFGKRP